MLHIIRLYAHLTEVAGCSDSNVDAIRHASQIPTDQTDSCTEGTHHGSGLSDIGRL